MRTAFFILLIILTPRLLSAQCGNPGRESNVTNAGTSFLFCFDWDLFVPSIPTNEIIYVTALGDSATVAITSRAYPQLNHVIQLSPHATASYRISDDYDMLLLSSDSVDDRAVRVRSTKPIICYGMSHIEASSDEFLAYPEATAGTEYRVTTYQNVQEHVPQSCFSVAAYNNGTQVTITPAAGTATGKAAGVPYTIVLDSGQSMQVIADTTAVDVDLTGSEVSATAPVAVFASHGCTMIPEGYLDPAGTASTCNHLAEAMPPVSTWGKTFITTSLRDHYHGDLIRVLALNDGTSIKINDTVWQSSLSKNSHADTLLIGANLIEATQPILVSELAHSGADFIIHGIGDPFLAIVPPIEEMYSDLSCYITDIPGFYFGNYIVVVTERSAKSELLLDGVLIPAKDYVDVPLAVNGQFYSVATVKVIPGYHHAVATKLAKFNLLIYGFGNFDSYGTTGGMLLKPLRGLSMKRISEHRSTAAISAHNILNEDLYLDSATVSSSLGDVRMVERVWQDVSVIKSGGTQAFHFEAHQNTRLPDTATLTIYSHSAQWKNLEAISISCQIASEDQLAVVDPKKLTAPSVSSYPNPAHGKTSTHFVLDVPDEISVEIFDLLGRAVRKLSATHLPSGTHDLQLNLNDLAPGVYRYALHTQHSNHEIVGWQVVE